MIITFSLWIVWLRSCALHLSFISLFLSSSPLWLEAQTAATKPAGPRKPYDILFVNGQIVDGTGNPWFYGDIAVRGERIVKITPPGLLSTHSARVVIDAHGLTITPGFIDIQSQSRDALLTGDGRVISKVTQGVTTEILGEDWTNAPANNNSIHAAITAGHPITPTFNGPHAFRQWLSAMKRHGTSTNFGAFVGGSTIRSYVMGMSSSPATSTQLGAMQALAREAMRDGAFGVAPALAFAPAKYFTHYELVSLAETMKPYGGFYAFHLRSEGNRLMDALDEVLQIGREAQVPVEIYHFKAAGIQNWSKEQLAINKIDQARGKGQDVGAFMYPYTARNGTLASCFTPLIPAGATLHTALLDSNMRSQIRKELLSEDASQDNDCLAAGATGSIVIGLHNPEHLSFIGKSLASIALAQHTDWIDLAMTLTASETSPVNMLFYIVSEENLELQMQQPWILFGTDFPGEPPATAPGPSHPRGFGTYTKLLGTYVRDLHVLSLEEAVRKMTSGPAERLSLRDRGRLAEGMYADIVVFDSYKVRDMSTYSNSNAISQGIRDVFVNGTEVVHDEKHTGAKPGKAIYGIGYGMK